VSLKLNLADSPIVILWSMVSKAEAISRGRGKRLVDERSQKQVY